MYAACYEGTVRITRPRRVDWMGFDRDNWARGVSFLLGCALLGLL